MQVIDEKWFFYYLHINAKQKPHFTSAVELISEILPLYEGVRYTVILLAQGLYIVGRCENMMVLD